MSLEEALQAEQRILRAGALVPILVTLSVLLLAAAGIYALMSFTVTQRRPEIGVRAALGARPGRLLWSIFSRAARQLMVGVAVGLTLLLLGTAIGGRLLGVPTFQTVVLVLGAGAFMTLVGLAAALGPARRGLRIQPTEALREA